MLSDDVRELIGFAARPVAMPAVRAADIIRYCVAIDDLDALYTDETCSVRVPDSELRAPLDFCQTYRFTDVPLAQLARDGLPPVRDGVPRIPGPLQRVVYGGASFDFHDRVRVGDEIVIQNTITDIQARDGQSGPALFCVVEMTCRRPEGELVTVMRTTTVYR